VILAIPAESTMTPGFVAVGAAAAIVLAITSIVGNFIQAYQISRLRDQVEPLVDAATPSFADEHAEAATEPEMPAVRPSPVPRSDTVESNMPLQLAQASLEIEKTEAGVEWREFTKSDGTVLKIKVRSSE
jgi:hypothetical protein